uniref:Uncharacterized protein n=1 Tax=Rhizophora mucronata TaxID=61149 RepID=A0A2P2PYY7_RHIMU
MENFQACKREANLLSFGQTAMPPANDSGPATTKYTCSFILS